MSEAKHTPGPWKADGSEESTATWVSGPDGKRICIMRVSEQDWHNACLIAAAPNLLDAAKEALAHFDRYVPDIVLDCKDSLRLAIAKAENRPTKL